MKKIYYLATCSTCQRIIKEAGITDREFVMQNIREEKITTKQLEEMKKMAGSYEALFSRRSVKYKELGLKDKTLGEKEYKQFILDDYTFLKRPVVIINNKIFIGNDKKTVALLIEAVKE